jgi:hypothetical protein
MTVTKKGRHEETTTEPIPSSEPRELNTRDPEFLRLPKPGRLCPLTGLSRSALNELILASPRNDFHPPVRSFCLRQRGARTGIRLIDYASLRTYILAHVDTCQDGGEVA